MKVAVTSLCVQAGVGVRTYYNALESVSEPSPATLRKLNTALGRFKLSLAGKPDKMALHGAYRCALVLAAAELKADPRSVLISDPARKATSDRIWMQEARARRLAYWITHRLLGFRVTEVADAAGVTKQAISKGVQEVEEDPDPAVRRTLERLTEIFE